MDSIEVGRIENGKNSSVVVSKFVGKDNIDRIDIRLFVQGDKYKGPTKKGVTLTKEKVPELVAILSRL